LEIKSLC